MILADLLVIEERHEPIMSINDCFLFAPRFFYWNGLRPWYAEFWLFGRNFSIRCMEKGYNRNLTGNWVAYAKSPSDFPNFPKSQISISEKSSSVRSPALKNLPSIWGQIFARARSRGIFRGKFVTSLNSDVKSNNFERLKNEGGHFLKKNELNGVGLNSKSNNLS